MKAKRVYFPPTTPQQRKLLFEIWEQTNNVTRACQKAHVGRTTFYYWKSRFDKAGYAGLERYEKTGVPKGTGRVAAEVETKVLELHAQHTDWGKHRLVAEIAKGNNWVPLVSSNTVRRILEDAGLWQPGEKRVKKSSFEAVSRTADEPGQTLNVDLCFVPVSHLVDAKLPAVSGSSSHLVVEHLKEPGQEPDYVEAVQAFVKASQPLFGPRQATAPSQQTEIQQVRQAEDQLRIERRNLRMEDAAWRVTWSQQCYPKPPAPAKLQPKPRARWGARKVQEEHRRDLHRQQRQQLQQRQQEDQQ